jgi:hypothetical protein
MTMTLFTPRNLKIYARFRYWTFDLLCFLAWGKNTQTCSPSLKGRIVAAKKWIAVTKMETSWADSHGMLRVILSL